MVLVWLRMNAVSILFGQSFQPPLEARHAVLRKLFHYGPATRQLRYIECQKCIRMRTPGRKSKDRHRIPSATLLPPKGLGIQGISGLSFSLAFSPDCPERSKISLLCHFKV